MRIIERLRAHARLRPRALAVQGARFALDYAALDVCVEALADELERRDVRVLGLMADNSPLWVALDLAAVAASVTLVPLPAFFSRAQLAHAIQDAGIDTIVADQDQDIVSLVGARSAIEPMPGFSAPGLAAAAFSVAHDTPRPDLSGTAKITYTSGTTGEPKGVRLTQQAIEAVAVSLLERIGARAVERHLSLLPLATLLENIGGVYVPLLAGGSCLMPPLAEVGVRGAAGLDAAAMAHALAAHGATSAILIPQMLQALVEQGARLPAARFLAVGGAPVSRRLLDQARALGLPAYEGYGLSECASVVSVNTPGDERPGSVGRPLPRARLKFAADGEIFVRGSVFQGYTGRAEGPDGEGWWASGDIGHLDVDGFLHLTGRKKNMFITSFGRNVAPEWVERELTAQGAIAQAAVFGEARPFNVAIVVPRARATRAEIEAAVHAANRELPDYARVGAWISVDEPFSPANGQLTATGRPRRAAILAAYGACLESLYESSPKLEVV